MVFVPSNLSCLPFLKRTAFPPHPPKPAIELLAPEAVGSEARHPCTFAARCPSQSVIKHQAK